jgi:aminopeptidase N
MKKLLLFLFPFFTLAQQVSKVDFLQCNASVAPNFVTKTIDGTVTYKFKVLSEIDSIRIDAKNMYFSNVTLNGKTVDYKNNKKELVLFEGYKNGTNEVSFSYKAMPKQTLYFVGIGEGQQIWTQGQGKYTSHWLPSFDDVNEKVIFQISVQIEEEMNSLSHFTAISNGELARKTNSISWSKGLKYWLYSYKMKKPMSSYLVMLAIGKFEHQTEISKSGIAIDNYYKPIDADKYPYTYKGSKVIFDYLEKEIGVKYPWKIYRQIPVEDFLYAGMENTTSTLFAQDFVVDSIGFNDRNYINVNAHELAHQWFGDLVTAKTGKHHWLQEGFATYYALLAEREIFGEDYFYYALYRNALQLRKAAKTDTIPVLNEKASSYSFYQKGAWALHVIREAIGEKAFQKAVKNYLKKYQYKNVETADFLNEIAAVSDFDVVKFQKEWLEDYQFPNDQALALLKKNQSIRLLFEIQAQKNKPFPEKESFFREVMKSKAFYGLKKEIINQIEAVPFNEKEALIRVAMQTNEVEVQQSVAETLKTIPGSFLTEYESLLQDNSYDTKEMAFVNLYKNFPENRAKYLEQAKNWVGKNDKGLRILYLSYYLDYNFSNANSSQYSKNLFELLEYTSPKFESSVRQNAFESALYLEPKNNKLLKNLVNAMVHPKWQLVKFARDTIRNLLKKEGYSDLFSSYLPDLSDVEKIQLQRLLDEK